jgi:hypothetical protein
MSLDSLREIYNPLAIKKEVKPPLQNWKESVPVILLSEYLKTRGDFGIKLCHDNGSPCLCFNPGLSRADKETGRWAIAEIVEGLFMDAADDLKELIANGKIDLPTRDHFLQYVPSLIKASGSFRQVEIHTGSKTAIIL